MALPPVSVLFEPVLCMPAWIKKYEGLSTRLVASGCPVNKSTGNAPCNPRDMATGAGKAIGREVSLEAYTLARYMQSEVGTKSVAERVAVAQDAINAAGTFVDRLLYRQNPGHLNYGFYGPIHQPVTNAAVYGRWAATSSDPSVANLVLAIAILNGEVPFDFNKGANDQYGPEVLIKRNGMASMINALRVKGANNVYWVGPLPGVDPLRTAQFTTRKDIDPKSSNGQLLINRAITMVQSPRPDWSKLPICGGGGSGAETNIITSAMPGIDFGNKGLIATIIGAFLTVGGILAAAVAWRNRKPNP